jgi:hypothetical protein
MKNRAFRITFDHQNGHWVIEFMKNHFVVFATWTVVKMKKEDGTVEPRQFNSVDEAYAFVNETGINKVYEDLTRGMPWEQTQEPRPAQQVSPTDIANALREVLKNDRQALAAS